MSRAANIGARVRNLLGLVTRPRPTVGTTPADVVFTENKWRLLRYRARVDGTGYRTPVLLVPSLINRHYILDLAPGKSFAEAMVARGHDVFVIDWGTPGPEDRYLSFDDIAGRYLARALKRCASVAGSDRVHLLGYCLGGLFTTLHVAALADSDGPEIASMTALAAPIDFHDGGLMSTWVRSPGFSVDALVDGFGNVPWQLMQASFHMLKPTMNLRKVVSLVDRAWDDQFLDGFFAVETWGSDNVSFPGECYRQYISDYYIENRLVHDRAVLCGRRALLSNIDCPLLVVTFEDDHIVPLQSALPLAERTSSTDTHHLALRGGHVGAVVSRKAAHTLWPRISEFWGHRDGDTRERDRHARVFDLR